jgi:hypothetical protein
MVRMSLEPTISQNRKYGIIRRQLKWHAGESSTKDGPSIVCMVSYLTIHQAPATIATRTSMVRILAPALSPVVTVLKVMGV